MRERLATKARHLRKELFVERGHDPRRTALVLGSGRSGTTWLAEAIARQHRARLLFEPFHPLLGSLGEGTRLFLDPAADEPIFARAAGRVLAGRARSPHVDQIRIARFPRGRIVKDVHAANLLPWLRAHHPEVPVVFVVRHPLAASLSRLRADVFHGLGDYVATAAGRADAEDSPAVAWLPRYDRWREHDEALVRQVAEWCLENAYPLSRDEDTGVALVFYETAVLEPVATLARLGEHCGSALGSARGAEAAIGEVRRPSAMDWRGTAAAAGGAAEWERQLGRWRERVSAPLLSECLAVLADFGLDGLYGEDPLPLGTGSGQAP